MTPRPGSISVSVPKGRWNIFVPIADAHAKAMTNAKGPGSTWISSTWNVISIVRFHVWSVRNGEGHACRCSMGIGEQRFHAVVRDQECGIDEGDARQCRRKVIRMTWWLSFTCRWRSRGLNETMNEWGPAGPRVNRRPCFRVLTGCSRAERRLHLCECGYPHDSS